jgi:gas vesicle protein GvpL/GvpF
VQAATALTPHALLYLYGLVRPSSDAAAIVSAESGGDIFAIDFAHVTCVAGIVDGDEYRQPRESGAAAQLDWVGPRAVRHHQVVRRLHGAGTVLPFKFGTLCSSAAALESALVTRRDSIAALFRRLDAKDEWTLKMSADESRLARATETSDPDLIALAREADRAAPGRAYFLRKKRQVAIADRVADSIAAVQLRIDDGLARLGVETVDNTSLLVDRSRFRDVEAFLAELEAEYAGVVAFELIGPWPPYSFAAVTV